MSSGTISEIEISKVRCEFYGWCPGEGRNRRGLAIAYRGPPLPTVPLSLNTYFRDCPSDFSAASNVCFSLISGHQPAQSACRLCAIIDILHCRKTESFLRITDARIAPSI